MRLLICLIVLVVVGAAADAPEAAVRAVLDEQTRTWNAGDLQGFVRTYAPDTVFVGKEVTRGTDGLLDRYRRNYPTREHMGTLEFKGVEVQMLGPDFASVLGRFHLTRSKAGGGDAQGVFTLLLRRTGTRWSIILDHTS